MQSLSGGAHLMCKPLPNTEEHRQMFLQKWENNPFMQETWCYDFEAAYSLQCEIDAGKLKGDTFFDAQFDEDELKELQNDPCELRTDAGGET